MKYLIIYSKDICSFLSGINLLFIIHYCLKVITCSPIHIKQSISTKKNGKDLSRDQKLESILIKNSLFSSMEECLSSRHVVLVSILSIGNK